MNKCKTKKASDDETKKQPEKFRKRLEASKRHKKTVIAAEAITFCIKPLTHYFPRSDLKFGEIETGHQEKQNAGKFYIMESVC